MNQMDAEHEHSMQDGPGGGPRGNPAAGQGAASGFADGPGLSPCPPSPLPPPQESPFSTEEYAAVFRRPQRAIEYILGSRERLARSVWDGRAVRPLAAMLLAVSLLAGIPYALAAPQCAWWKITVLYCGSLGVCFPSLHAFAQFLGARLDLVRSLAISLIITATAALFTFAFFPVIWFLDYSIVPAESTLVGPRQLSVFLIAMCLVLGLVQLAWCLAEEGPGRTRQGRWLGLLLFLWTPLLIFITYHMALLLEVI